MVREVEFQSEGATLRGMLYLPTSRAPKAPLVIMGHGTSATVYMVADKYAEALSQAGFGALLYDHRNLGRSEGEPRGELNPWIQCRGFRDAINFAETLDEVDRDRIALWGDSWAGAHVMVVAAIDPRVKAIIAQIPGCGSAVPSIEPTAATFEVIKAIFHRGDIRGTPETTTGPMPVVSFDQVGVPSLLKPIQAFRWFIDYGGRPGSHWINRATRVLPPTPVPYSAVLSAPFIKVPTLVMVAPDDEMENANPKVSKHAYDLMSGPKQLYEIHGGHFGLLYHPSERFDEATGVQISFLNQWLKGA